MIYQVMPDLTADEYAELKADIQQRGVMIPIEFDENGNVLDGHHRLQICKELGIKDFPKVIRSGMTEEEKRAHARKLNMARRHLSQEQKRGLIREQLKETPEKSDRQIARDLGVDHKTVTVRRNELETTGEIPQLKTNIGADGKERPRQAERKTIPETTPEAKQEPEPIAEEIPVIYFEETPDYCIDVIKKQIQQSSILSIQEEPIQKTEYTPEHKPHVSFNSGNNEWYTPSEYIEAARKTMGSIDLDPASSEIANKTVQAEKYYTAETNGLSHVWTGNIWLNPPYSSDLIGRFADKLVSEREHYSQAIVLVNNATETEWFCKIVKIASAVIFPKSRVKFYTPNGTKGTPLQGQAILYVGNQPQKFIENFFPFGWGAYLNGV